MEALINAGGRGSRMGFCSIEKPMQMVGDKNVIQRVIDAVSSSSYINRVLISVSDNTIETERYLRNIGIETVHTSGNDFMNDLHDAFSIMDGEYVLTCPQDLPLLTTDVVNTFIECFVPGVMESAIAVVDENIVKKAGMAISYTRKYNGKKWVLSGLSIMNRKKTINGNYLEEYIFKTDWIELSINVNTPKELDIARKYFNG